MRDALRKPAFAVEPFGETHLVAAAEQLVHHPAHFPETPRFVAGYGVAQVPDPELDVVEVRDRLAQRPVLHVRQHGLKLAECPAGKQG